MLNEEEVIREKVQEANQRLRKHKLLTKELKARFAEVGKQDIPDPIVVCKFFSPYSNWTWFATAYEPEEEVFFGMVHGFEKELGYFALQELAETTVFGGVPAVERDCHWTEKRLSEIGGND